MEKEKIRIGKITKPHGLKGEFKVYPYTDDKNVFLSYDKIYIGEIPQLFNLQSSRLSNNMFICKLKDYDKIENIEKFINKYIYIDYKDKRAMGKDEYLFSDLIGLDVYEGDNRIGIMDDVLRYPVCDIFKVIGDNSREILIPNIKQFVKEIDIEKGIIQVALIEGM